ncbi:MAG: EAL domain-containing protein [Pseudomonadota bacterium]
MSEKTRLECLRKLALDRFKQPQLISKITQLATIMLDCPTALVAIVEEEREWFLGRTGADIDEIERDKSFCSICIEDTKPLLISDVMGDERFCDHPARRAGIAARSYLGVPIMTECGHAIGTLCVASPEPDAFAQSDIASLSTLAELVEQCIIAHARATELGRANVSLKELNMRFRQAESAAQIGSWRVDLASDSLHWSDQVFQIHGLPVGTPIDVKSAVEFYEPEDRDLVQKSLEEAIANGEPFSFEANIRRFNGEIRRIRALGERIDEDGQPEAVAGVFLDCTEEHLQTAALKHAAERDRLTGLFNRSAFDKRLTHVLIDAGRLQRERQETVPVTVALIDLDGFKGVNDTLGHLVGDRLLSQIAQQLNRLVDQQYFLARWGGDEFAILFPPGTPSTEVNSFAEMLVNEISEQVRVGEDLMVIGATCGLAMVHAQSTNDELLRRADMALYHGKSHGRGVVHWWSEEIENSQSVRQKAIARLTRALESKQTYAAYQPIVDLASNTIVAVEALLRFTENDGRSATASTVAHAFIDPVISRKVSRFMLEEIAREAPELLELYGPDLRVGINVSEADLRQGGFLGALDKLVGTTPLAPQNVVLEVTETMLLLDDSQQIRRLLTELDRRGFTIALDDFGTGYSSLTHLRDFPIRKVKIDRDFIANITTDQQSRLIVQAIVQMGKGLGLRMVAEGVETEAQATYLRSLGCTHAQGYLFAQPQALRDLKRAARLTDGAKNAA